MARRASSRVIPAPSQPEQRDWPDHAGDDVVYAWASLSSSGTTTYETILKRDGTMSCNCPGWVFARKGGDRICKHIREYAGEAATIMGRIRAGQRVDWNRVPVPPQAPKPKTPAPRADAASVAAILKNRRAISFEE